MNEHRTNPAEAPAASDAQMDRNAPVRDDLIRLLEELAELGSEIARAEGRLRLAQIEAEIKEAEARTAWATQQEAAPAEARKPESADAGSGARTGTAAPRKPVSNNLCFERAIRAVGMLTALRTRLLLDREAWDQRVAEREAQQERQATEERQQRERKNRNQAQDVLNEIVARDRHPDQAALIRRNVTRWFNEREPFAGLLDRPIGELVAMACRDLGLKPNWPEYYNRPWLADALAKVLAEAAAPEAEQDEPTEAGAEESEAGEVEAEDVEATTAATDEPETAEAPEIPPTVVDTAPPPPPPAEAPVPEATTQPAQGPPSLSPERLAELRRRGVQPFQNPSIYWP